MARSFHALRAAFLPGPWFLSEWLRDYRGDLDTAACGAEATRNPFSPKGWLVGLCLPVAERYAHIGCVVLVVGGLEMKLSSRVLLTLGIAGVLAAAPAFVPLPQNRPVEVASIGCGARITSRTIDSANAIGIVPCPVQVQSTATPWAVIVVGAGVVSVMINAAVVYQTQCRELTLQEAYSSAFLPVIGWLFNQQHSQCGHPGHR
jgi:hypothetical protein